MMNGVSLDRFLDALDDRLEGYRLPKYLKVKEAAAIAAVTPGTIRSWVRKKALKEFRAGNDLRVLLSDLENYLARNNPEATLDMDARVREMMA